MRAQLLDPGPMHKIVKVQNQEVWLVIGFMTDHSPDWSQTPWLVTRAFSLKKLHAILKPLQVVFFLISTSNFSFFIFHLRSPLLLQTLALLWFLLPSRNLATMVKKKLASCPARKNASSSQPFQATTANKGKWPMEDPSATDKYTKGHTTSSYSPFCDAHSLHNYENMFSTRAFVCELLVEIKFLKTIHFYG